MDEARAAELFDLVAPELATWEQSVRESEPGLSEAEVLDRALRCALSELRQEISQQTLTYLRWRAEQARASAAATVAASIAAREARTEARAAAQRANERPSAHASGAPPKAPQVGPSRRFIAADDSVWTAQEIELGSVAWAHAPRCLVFQSAVAIRRVWHYPAEWRSLSDAALETLSWHV
jgi:hypothetical protein